MFIWFPIRFNKILCISIYSKIFTRLTNHKCNRLGILIKKRGDMSKIILAIDDEETCLEIISFALEAIGYNVLTASSAAEGLQIIENNSKIDLILLDMMLPDIYGIKALAQIRKIEQAKNIPIIIQTGSSNFQDLSHAVANKNAQNIIMKPYSRAELVSMVNQTMMAEV
jgi:CheY-like chemotaxis protein